MLNVKTDIAITKVVVISPQGTVLLERDNIVGDFSLDVSDYSSGLYFFNALMEDGSSVVKSFVVD